MMMSVAAPEVVARTDCATGGLAAEAPPGLLPRATMPSMHTSRETSAPLHVAAKKFLM
jgi:hypothetical protein